MHEYIDKAALYARIEERRNRWGISLSDYPINILNMCKSFKYLIIQEAPFTTPGLRGIATKRELPNKSDIIILNSCRTDLEKAFDCTHELIHLAEHRQVKAQSFHCFEKILPQQNAFLEWQANEGAAEMLVPYMLLLQMINERKNYLQSWRGISGLNKLIAEYFNVSEAVISFRFESLKYEINQLLEGCPIDRIKILSSKKQSQLGIRSKSLNDIAIELMSSEMYNIYVTAEDKELLDQLKLGRV
ncbi:MAG: ImmA/IrrE family metallo-endopeptidase [Bacillota bacterium]